MRARDVMVSPVLTVRPDVSVKHAAKILIENCISALPVVNNTGVLVGIVSEGDLMRRVETGTEKQRSWWLRFLAGEEVLASEYAQSHARNVADVMTRELVTASPDAPLNSIADLMEKHAIKRVPIVRDGELVGIVSRANLVQALVSAPKALEIPTTDGAIRDTLLRQLRAQPWSHSWQLNVTVHHGIVDLWGVTYSENERRAIRIAAENIPGVLAVNDRLYVRPIVDVEV